MKKKTMTRETRRKIAKLLKTAASVLEDFGWTQRNNARDQYGNGRTVSDPLAKQFCANGALLKAVNILDINDITRLDAIDLVEKTIRKPVGRSTRLRLTTWNDTIVKKKEQVINKFRKVAKDLLRR